MPVRKNVTYTNIITNPTTDDGYTGVLYTWVNNGYTNPCTFYTSWYNSSSANDSNAKGYILENGIYKAKSLWDDILQVGFSSYLGYSGSYINFEDIGIRVYAQRQSVKQTSTKLYLPVRKKTDVLLYADDGYEGILYEWDLKTSFTTFIGTIYSPLDSGRDTNWNTTTVYELDGNVFKHRSLWGTGGWLDDYGYGDCVYGDGSTSTLNVELTSSNYPRLARDIVDGVEYNLPVIEVVKKNYLPVRKNNGTTKYYT